MKKVEKFKITKQGKAYLDRVKALASVRKILAMKKKQIDVQSMMLGQALQETHKGLLQATQIPGEELMEDISVMEEDHA